MNHLADKLCAVERDIAADRGRLNFFAVLERADVPGWDLVVSARWARSDPPTLRYLASAIQRHLAPAEAKLLSRFVILAPEQDPVRALTEKFEVEHGRIDLIDPARFGLPVKQGYIITSRRGA